MSGLPHCLTLTAHFCPACGDQCSCQDARVSSGADDEEVVEVCTHRCDVEPPDVDRVDGLDDGCMGSIDAEYATTADEEECPCLSGEPDRCRAHGRPEQVAARERALSEESYKPGHDGPFPF